MIVALSVMALVALEPQPMPSLRSASIEALPELPVHDVPRPTLDSM
jgi:hypothetical protein